MCLTNGNGGKKAFTAKGLLLSSLQRAYTTAAVLLTEHKARAPSYPRTGDIGRVTAAVTKAGLTIPFNQQGCLKFPFKSSLVRLLQKPIHSIPS